MTVTAWLAFFVGLLSFISPCVLPLVPAYIGYMGNRITAYTHVDGSDNALSDGTSVYRQRLDLALHGFAFVAGFTFVFVVFGLAVVAGTRLLSTAAYEMQREVIPRIGGTLIILFGLHHLGAIMPVLKWLESRPALDRAGRAGAALKRSLNWLQVALYSDTRVQMPRRSHGLVSSGMMGVVFAAGWSPCIGPIYGSILTMAATDSASIPRAAGLLGMYSLGLGVPFILTAIAMDRASGLLKRLRRYLPGIKLVSGVTMIVIGILIFTGTMQRLSQLGAANAAFSYKVEQCATSVLTGALELREVGTCLNNP